MEATSNYDVNFVEYSKFELFHMSWIVVVVVVYLIDTYKLFIVVHSLLIMVEVPIINCSVCPLWHSSSCSCNHYALLPCWQKVAGKGQGWAVFSPLSLWLDYGENFDQLLVQSNANYNHQYIKFKGVLCRNRVFLMPVCFCFLLIFQPFLYGTNKHKHIFTSHICRNYFWKKTRSKTKVEI